MSCHKLPETFHDSIKKWSCQKPQPEFMTNHFSIHSVSQLISSLMVIGYVQSIMSSHFGLGAFSHWTSSQTFFNELYILIQRLFHISVISSLCSFPSQPGAQCNCCSSLQTLNVYTNESLIWQWMVTQLIIMFKFCETKKAHLLLGIPVMIWDRENKSYGYIWNM